MGGYHRRVIAPETSDLLIERLTNSNLTGFAIRELAMKLLGELPTYNWSGIYRLDGEELILDAYVGEETEHTRIKVGVGVCGTAVAENANQVIHDVRELSNYLACSLKTRSELVVLIREGDNIIGQIDIDGHEVGAFDLSDESLLEKMAEVLASRWN